LTVIVSNYRKKLEKEKKTQSEDGRQRKKIQADLNLSIFMGDLWLHI